MTEEKKQTIYIVFDTASNDYRAFSLAVLALADQHRRIKEHHEHICERAFDGIGHKPDVCPFRFRFRIVLGDFLG